MKLAMILGRKQGQAIKPRLQNIKDNLDIDVFEDVPEFIYNVSRRNTIYDRILVLSTKIDNVSLQDLNTCWGMYSKETSVILLSKKGSDESKAKMFLDVFRTPVACAMLVSTTTVQVIAESVLRPTSELNKDYGYKDFLAVEFDEDEYIPPEPPKPEQPVTPPQQEKPADKPQEQQQAGKKPGKKPAKKKKRGGFLSSIFGSRGGSDEEEESEQSEDKPQEETQVEQTSEAQPEAPKAEKSPVNLTKLEQAQSVVASEPLGVVHDEEPLGVVHGAEPEPLGVVHGEEPSVVASEPEPAHEEESPWDDFDVPPEPAPSQDTTEPKQKSNDPYADLDADFGSSEETIEEKPAAVQSQEDDADSIWGATSTPKPATPPVQQTKTPPTQPSRQPSQIKNKDVIPPTTSSIVDVSFEDTLIDEEEQDNDFAPQSSTADVDFGSDGTIQATPDQRQLPKKDVSQADENLGDVSVLDDEAKYRQQHEAQRVVTRTVRDTSSTVLAGVLAGKLRKVIIVTGDRGTGVTSTALSLAYAFAKHVDVLFFDCDTMHHGLLNYIDYANFQNYEETHLSGVKVCKTNALFDRCVILWDDNLSILSSDFSCDCSDDELRVSAGIVAERASDYGVVVVDCPAERLHCIQDLLLTGHTIICVEDSKRGFMNMLCSLESSELSARFKRNMITRGSMFVTKVNPKVDLRRLLNYVKAIYQPDEVDWLSLGPIPFNGRVSESLLNKVLEG